MKQLIFFILTLHFIPASNLNKITNENYKVKNNIIEQDIPDNLIYKYGVFKIIKEQYIYNLGSNVQSYLNSKNWNHYMREEFIDSYKQIMAALKENRLSADSFGTITDTKGEISNTDKNDYWYDNKGNRITGLEYRALSPRKQKKYWTFYANKEVALYFSIIAQAIINKQE